jgi:hypothetical protein
MGRGPCTRAVQRRTRHALRARVTTHRASERTTGLPTCTPGPPSLAAAAPLPLLGPPALPPPSAAATAALSCAALGWPACGLGTRAQAAEPQYALHTPYIVRLCTRANVLVVPVHVRRRLMRGVPSRERRARTPLASLGSRGEPARDAGCRGGSWAASTTAARVWSACTAKTRNGARAPDRPRLVIRAHDPSADKAYPELPLNVLLLWPMLRLMT